MTAYETWLKELDAAEAVALGTAATKDDTTQPLSEIDQAVHDLCAGYSEAELLAAAASAPDTLTQARGRLTFKPSVVAAESVEEAYQQLLGIADELIEELTIRPLDDCKEYVQGHIAHIRAVHDSGQLARRASSLAEGLDRLKKGLEKHARTATKTQGLVADVGQLLLLTALSAHELRRALHQEYGC